MVVPVKGFEVFDKPFWETCGGKNDEDKVVRDRREGRAKIIEIKEWYVIHWEGVSCGSDVILDA